MSFSAFIPVALAEAANATLEGLGHGANNFSVPERPAGSNDTATHAGLSHLADDAVFQAHVAAIPGVTIQAYGTLVDGYPTLKAAQAFDPDAAANWTLAPIMIGDRRTYAGKEWESLVDFNVWTPPVAWREIVVEGYPEWVQPTGAHDAYPLGFRVTFNGQNWENTGSAANVWQPGVFGWVVIP